MMPTHILLKFISKEKYLKEFLAGSLYMNTLYYFWNEFMLEDVKKGKRVPLSELGKNEKYGQLDLFEGTIGTIEAKNSPEMEKYMPTDICARAIGCGYCNILSFYRLDLTHSDFYVSYDLNNMASLGDFVVIIKDKDEFIRRISIAAEKENYKFLCGNVSYWQAMKNGVPRDKRNAIICKSDDVIDIRNLNQRRDVFVKMDKYAYQNEWRLALYRDVKETKAYRLEVGRLDDIIEWCPRKEITNKIDDCLQKGKIKFALNNWTGNISRKDMKELFYKLGDYKGELLLEIG